MLEPESEDADASELTEAVLHARIVEGDFLAMDEWQKRHKGNFIAAVRILGVQDADAEIIWNRVFGSTINAAPKLLAGGGSLRDYCFGSRKRAVALHFRERDRGIETVPLEPWDSVTGAYVPLEIEATPNSMQSIRAGFKNKRLLCCLRHAPAKHRVVARVLMRGGSTDDIAAARGIDAGSARQAKRRSLEWLRKCLTVPP